MTYRSAPALHVAPAQTPPARECTTGTATGCPAESRRAHAIALLRLVSVRSWSRGLHVAPSSPQPTGDERPAARGTNGLKGQPRWPSTGAMDGPHPRSWSERSANSTDLGCGRTRVIHLRLSTASFSGPGETPESVEFSKCITLEGREPETHQPFPSKNAFFHSPTHLFGFRPHNRMDSFRTAVGCRYRTQLSTLRPEIARHVVLFRDGALPSAPRR